MRCVICNSELSLKESKWNPDTGSFNDTCNSCNSEVWDCLMDLRLDDEDFSWSNKDVMTADQYAETLEREDDIE